MKFDSNQLKSYKSGLIKTLTIRNLRICSTNEHQKTEIERSREVLADNGYPPHIIRKGVREGELITQRLSPPKQQTAPVRTIYFTIAYYGAESIIFVIHDTPTDEPLTFEPRQMSLPIKMSIVKSSKNKDQLLLDGFRYRHANKSQVKWGCVKNVVSQYIKLTDHSDAPNPDEIIAAEFNSKISERAITSYDPPGRVINEALLDVHKDDGTAIPSYTASQCTIERKRKKDDIPLPKLTSFEDISIPQQLTVTNGGDRFLLYDNEDSDDRTIILLSDDALNRLSNSEYWHAYGTFKVAPQLFYQLYTIHGFIRGRSVPLVYALLPGKSEAVYGELFNVLVQNVNKHPKSITIDFERAVENVIKQKLPTTTISGCFFHFKQALWRKIQVHT
ncbi:unnamed protein product [Didymodactylos carnosus]|uniref:MULE transposase domain-containing protein n=1 Tax=Didymodactylos carnosus TaxID=1234261 RepID=A0A8S2HW94_9BILA|nr:unnamed protein product [Didymodactylos carnosus]CAF3691879.1 unnamed protein product [Didymodactylos carnosus]